MSSKRRTHYWRKSLQEAEHMLTNQVEDVLSVFYHRPTWNRRHHPAKEVRPFEMADVVSFPTSFPENYINLEITGIYSAAIYFAIISCNLILITKLPHKFLYPKKFGNSIKVVNFLYTLISPKNFGAAVPQ